MTEDPTARTVALDDFDALWNYRNPAATEDAFRIVLARARAAGETSAALEILTQIARTHSLRGQFDEAHAVLDEVEAEARARVGEIGEEAAEADGGLVVVRVRLLLERGRAFNSARDGSDPRAGAKTLGDAREQFSAAWVLARARGLDALAVDAAHMLGIVSQGDGALMWNEKAIAHAEQAEDPDARRLLGALYNNVGWTYHDLGRFEDALAQFEKALAWRLERDDVVPIRIAKWSVARAQRSLGRIDEALRIQTALRDEWAAEGGQDGYVFEELGELYLVKGDEAAARENFAKAAELLGQDGWFAENEAERLARLRELGGVGEG